MEDTINDLRRRIKYKIAHLTESQKVIANYIVENPQKFVLCSVRKLENELKISKSTIVRSAQALGYNGIYELKSLLLKGMKCNFGHIPRNKSLL